MTLNSSKKIAEELEEITKIAHANLNGFFISADFSELNNQKPFFQYGVPFNTENTKPIETFAKNVSDFVDGLHTIGLLKQNHQSTIHNELKEFSNPNLLQEISEFVLDACKSESDIVDDYVLKLEDGSRIGFIAGLTDDNSPCAIAIFELQLEKFLNKEILTPEHISDKIQALIGHRIFKNALDFFSPEQQGRMLGALKNYVAPEKSTFPRVSPN